MHNNKFYAVCNKCGASIELTKEGFIKYNKILGTIIEKELDNIIENEEDEEENNMGVV
jgi:hypothetical protein